MEADPRLVSWFRDSVKPAFPDAHVSWSWRGEKEQNEAFAEGKSKLSWPNSKHNACLDDGIPCARALDLFELASNGLATWRWKWFKEISDACLDPNIIWGGTWKTISDSDHFELS